MDYKTIAQQTSQEVFGYNQDTSGWKVVKNSVRKQSYFKNLYFNENSLLKTLLKKFLLPTRKIFLLLCSFFF